MNKPPPLKDYQRKNVEKIEGFGGRALLADSMGLGKTASALHWARENLGPGTIVVICPACVKLNWKREAWLHTRERARVLSGMTPPNDVPPKGKRSRIYVVNYDILEEQRRRHKGGASHLQGWLRWLKRLKPRLVIIDEAHKLQSRKSKRTKAVKELCRKVPHVLALSGTPLINRPFELWPTLNILRPDIWTSAWTFGKRYCKPERTPWGWVYRGATRLKELRKRLLADVMVRNRKEDVLKELPTKTRKVIPVEIDSKEYNEASQNLVKWLKKNYGRSKAKKALKAERLTRMGYLKRLAARLKLKSVIQWIQDFLDESGEKLIVFGVHKEILGAIQKHFKTRCVLVDGSVSGDNRQELFDRFNRNPACDLLVGNIQAAGVGWSCTSATNVLFAELAWTPGEHTQAEDRIHGLGRGMKGKKAFLWYLVGAKTIEEDLCKILQRKQRTLTATLDGGRVRNELNTMDLLTEALTRKGVR